MSVALNLPFAPVDSRLLRQAVLYTVSYADVFDYPLTVSEIHRYLTGERATVQEVAWALDDLVENGATVQVGEWFTLPGREGIIELRRHRSQVAARLWQKAMKYGRILASLPYVQMVAVTGSLAVSNAERGKDIDFMLVAAPHRLWTCRALAILVARLAALEGVTLCPNYLVTTDALEFGERSLYVAHEVAQMVPLSGMEIYLQIRSLNMWTDEYLPNALGLPQVAPDLGISRGRQRQFEAALAFLPVEWFERWEMRRKIRKLSRQQSSSPEAYFSADVCKGHVDRHMQHTETLLRTRLEGLNSI